MKTILMLVLFFAIGFTTHSQIKTHAINQTLIGPSSITIDIDSNSTDDFTFDILILSPGVYAARVLPVGLTSILDNSTFGYADALNFGDPVTGYFHSGIGVLGTIAGAGQFNGQGIKYLGFKINRAGLDHYGWFKLNCSENRDTLEIISVGYNTIATAPITAGQTSSLGINNENAAQPNILLYPNPASTNVSVHSTAPMQNTELNIYDSFGQLVKIYEYKQENEATFSIEDLENGIYFIHLTTLHNRSVAKTTLLVNK